MDSRDNRYKRAEQHYRDRTEIYEDRERKILKQRGNYKNKQKRFNFFFVLPIILLAVTVFPKIMEYYEKNPVGTALNSEKPPSVREVIDYLELSKCTEESTEAVLKAYADNEDIDIAAIQTQQQNVSAVFDALSTEKPPLGFEEYNEYQLYVLATDMELLKVMCEERTPDMKNYFNTMVQRRNSLAGHRKDCMKAVLDNFDGIKYTENPDGSIKIEYYS